MNLDKTFCLAYGECINGRNCERAATPDIFDAASIIGRSVSCIDKMDCFDSIKID